MAYVTLDLEGKVTGVFGSPQPGLPGFAVIADGDHRISDFTKAQEFNSEARSELEKSDLVAMRCFKAGIDFPAEWVEYCEALRDIIRFGGEGLPERPDYPAL